MGSEWVAGEDARAQELARKHSHLSRLSAVLLSRKNLFKLSKLRPLSTYSSTRHSCTTCCNWHLLLQRCTSGSGTAAV